MSHLPGRPLRAAAAMALVALPLAVAACGSDKSSKSTAMTITTSSVGKNKFKTDAPKSIKGGVVEITFHNQTKAPGDAQLIRVDGNHSAQEVLRTLGSDNPVIPDWLHGEGGVATTPPGQTATVKVKLPPGTYFVADDQSANGPPPAVNGALAVFRTTGNNGGELKSTDATIEAKTKGSDEFEWVTSGLKAGDNELTFDNTSDQIHHVIAAPIVGNATIADVKKGLVSQKGPAPLDEKASTGTAIMDGKRKEVTHLRLKKGRYALVCFLKDRDGKGKPHFEEGMLKEVDIK